jgi:NADH:ubiquinone oxidoreductase subunit D
MRSVEKTESEDFSFFQDAVKGADKAMIHERSSHGKWKRRTKGLAERLAQVLKEMGMDSAALRAKGVDYDAVLEAMNLADRVGGMRDDLAETRALESRLATFVERAINVFRESASTSETPELKDTLNGTVTILESGLRRIVHP